MKGDNSIMAAMITTIDNPHDPRTDFLSWYAWDTQNGYNTCAYLARVALVSPELPEPVTDQEIEDAIDEIIRIHAGGMYMKLPLFDAA
jgi:hypothetical protein